MKKMNWLQRLGLTLLGFGLVALYYTLSMRIPEGGGWHWPIGDIEVTNPSGHPLSYMTVRMSLETLIVMHNQTLYFMGSLVTTALGLLLAAVGSYLGPPAEKVKEAA
jgi:hypothetical protein